jgi:uncharacterized small protein (DUF1192 family)
MHVKRTATIVLGGGALAAWLAGAATSNRALPDPVLTRPAQIDARGATLASEIEKLRERLRPSETPRTPARNLFTFRAAAARASAPMLAPEPRAAIVEMPAPPRPVEPPLKLSGIAEDPGPDGPVRMAFISGEGQLYMVKVGDPVTARYKVERISSDVVELLDLTENTTRRLAMRQ